MDARLAELLGTVPYSSSMTVALGFDAADFARPPDGFGFLVPKKERRRLVACTWVGTKFSHRVPAGKIVARCFLGGMEDAAVLEESDESIVAAVTRELHEIAGVTARPRFSRIFRWPRSMAQYLGGASARLAEIEARVAAIPGLAPGRQRLPGHRHSRLHPHGARGGGEDSRGGLDAAFC